MRESGKNIPYPAAFREIAIAIRKDIRARRKVKNSANDLLRELYKWAVIENFFTGIDWYSILTKQVLHSTALSCVKGIKTPYLKIGYKNLGLLNKTDLKWLVEAFGEPDIHATAKDVNEELWQEAVETFRVEEQRDERDYWRSHGFDGPPDKQE